VANRFWFFARGRGFLPIFSFPHTSRLIPQTCYGRYIRYL
jgi:hypothetical protein